MAAKYRDRRTHEVVTAITFDELVEHGRREVIEKRSAGQTPTTMPPNETVAGMPYSFNYMGNTITYEDHNRYLVPTIDQRCSSKPYLFCRGQMLVAFSGPPGVFPPVRLVPYPPETFLDEFESLTPQQSLHHDVDKSLFDMYHRAHEEMLVSIVKWVTEAAITHKMTGEQALRAAVEAGYNAAKNGVPKITIPK